MSIPRLPDYDMPSLDVLKREGTPIHSRVNWKFKSERAVLLIHDMQRYFTGFYSEDSVLVKQLIANIVHLREHCRTLGIPVVYTAQPTQQAPADRALLNDMWGPGLTAADPASAAIVPALAPDEKDITLTKWRYSAFTRSDLHERMHAWNRDQLLICGVYASIGCMTTALDAFMQDIQPFLLADAVADFGLNDHLMALRYVGGRCGRILESKDILTATQAKWTLDDLRMTAMGLLDDAVDDLDENENLLDYGLNSMRLMALVAEWRSRGIDISFEELARTPSLRAWERLLHEKQNTLATNKDFA